MEEKKKTPKIEHIANEIEELEVQLKLGKLDLTDSINNRKKELAGLIRKVYGFGEKVEKESEEKLHEVKEKTDELLDILDADFNFSYTDYDDEHGHLLEKLQELERKAKEVYEKLEQEASKRGEKVKEEFSVGMEKFKNELKIHQKQLQNRTDEAVSEFNEWRQERLKDIENIKELLEEKKSEVEEKTDTFNTEISKAYSHLKKAFGL